MAPRRDTEGPLVEYSTFRRILNVSDGPGKSKGESSGKIERTHNRIRSPRCVASSVQNNVGKGSRQIRFETSGKELALKDWLVNRGIKPLRDRL